MKELSIEEKAKAYDEAIDKIKYVMEHGVSPTLNKEDLQDIFPELKESEDEKLKKALIQNLKERFGTKGNMGEGLDMPDVLTWLEKQGEQKASYTNIVETGNGGINALVTRELPTDGEQKPTDEEMIALLRTEYEKGRADAIAEMQKPAWSEEDELHIRELESLVKQEWAIAERENDKDKVHKISDLSFFLKTLKPQPKQEWSEA